ADIADVVDARPEHLTDRFKTDPPDRRELVRGQRRSPSTGVPDPGHPVLRRLPEPGIRAVVSHRTPPSRFGTGQLLALYDRWARPDPAADRWPHLTRRWVSGHHCAASRRPEPARSRSWSAHRGC